MDNNCLITEPAAFKSFTVSNKGTTLNLFFKLIIEEFVINYKSTQ